MRKTLTSKEESFCKAFILHKRNSIEAYRHSEYSQKLPPDQMSVQAHKLLQKPNLILRIEELQEKATKIAEESFNITVTQRLKWLQDIAEAGIATYKDSSGSDRRESLTAARGAIETMNSMLGVTDSKDKKIKPIDIGVIDAS
tara:strand:+ start:83 stop:511 length:429 start_codon:yes stop_codon:yes gene_type:complete